MIRVGRRSYQYGSFEDPQYDGFMPIIVMTPSTKYGSLSPYSLKNEKGQIMENIWQFSKVYERVPKVEETYSRYNPKIIWSWPLERHVENGKLTKKYIKWREAGHNAKYAIRYPVGFRNRSNCLFALETASLEDCKVPIDELPKLNYIEARKRIYIPEYIRLVKEAKQFKELKALLAKGVNLLIIEVDGPHQESLGYYQDKYNVGSDFIQKNTVLATIDNLQILLNDDKHPFGHGHCLAAALLDLNLF